MKAPFLCAAMLFVLALIVPPSAGASGIAGEQITSPVLQKALDSLRADRKEEAAGIIAGFRPDSEKLDQFYFVSGKVMKAMGNPLEAAGQFRKAYLYAPQGELKELALIERAETYLAMGYFYEARSVYLVFLKEFPQSGLSGRVYPGLARSLAATGGLREAVAAYDKAGDSPAMLAGKAIVLSRLGKYQEAEKIFDALLKTDEPLLRSSEENLYYLGENLRQLKRLPEAARYLSAVQEEPFKSRADLGLGLIAMEQGRTEDALKLFAEAQSSGDRETMRRSLLFTADIELQQGKSGEAERRLEELRNRYPYGRTYEEGLLLLSRIFIKEDKPDRALPLLRELAFSSSFAKEALDEFQNMLSRAKTGDRERFLGLWKSAGRLLLDASREDFLFEVADILRDAEGAFLEIVQFLVKYGTTKGKIKSLELLAGYYAEQGRVGSTEDCLVRLKEMKVRGEALVRIEARLAWLKKDFRSAAEKLLRLKTLGPGDLRLLGDLVSAYPKDRKALERFEKAVKETGGDVRSYTMLADIMYRLGRAGEALRYYRAALEEEPGNDWVLFRIGSLTKGGEAEEALKKVGRGDPVIAKLAEIRLRELDLARKGIGNF